MNVIRFNDPDFAAKLRNLTSASSLFDKTIEERTRAILDAVAAGAPNLRLPLGADAVAGIRGKLASVARDVDATEAVATATAFDA